MKKSIETEVFELLSKIRPLFAEEHVYIVDLAKSNMSARIAIAMTLIQSDRVEGAKQLLKSIIESEALDHPEDEQARLQALVELAYLEMEDFAYDKAEDYLWEARDRYKAGLTEDLNREHILLLLAQCRFGQGFVQESIDRAEEVLALLEKVSANRKQFARTHQQLGWFYFHKADLSNAFRHIRAAMEHASDLEQGLVEAGREAEQTGDFEKAIEHYFDAICLK